MLIAFLPETLVERIGWLLVHSVWQFALVALVLAAVLQAMRRRSANARYAACVLAWAAIVAMPAVTWMLLPVSAPGGAQAARSVPLVVEPVSLDAVRAVAAARPEKPAQVVPVATRWTAFGDPPGPVDASQPPARWWASVETSIAPWLEPLVALWCVGVLLFALRPAWGWYTVSRLKRRGTSAVPPLVVQIVERGCRRLALRQNVQVLQSALVGAPAMVGLLRPLILLPLSVVNGLSPTQLEAILAHELAHIRRHDYLVNLLQTLSETIFFYHPALWWVSSRIRHEREHCCDELAAEALGNRADYGRALLALEELRGTAPVLSLGARGGSLLERIRRLAGVEPSPRWNGGVAGFALLALLLTGIGVWTATHAGAGMQVAPEPENRAARERVQGQSRVDVSCVDAEGEPVAGAEVHLFQYDERESRYVHSGPFTSDEQGRVVSDEALFTDQLGHFDRWIYARVPGRLVGAARSAKWKNREVVNPEFRVELQPSRSVEGQVTVPDGFDPMKVTVGVRVLHIITGPGDSDYASFPREDAFSGLDTALPEVFESRPDADGHIRFNDVPVRGRLYLVTVGQGLGEAQWWNGWTKESTFEKPVRLALENEGVVTGRALSPDGEPARGLRVAARLSSGASDGFFYLSTFRAVTDENGEFTLRGMPGAGFVLSVEHPQEPWVFRPRENVLVDSGETLSLDLQMETGIVVSGRVLGPEGKPVEGAAFSALADTEKGPGLAHDSTDADGRYEFRLPAGAAKLYFNALPEGFAYPDPQIVKRLDLKAGQAAIKNLDFTLQREPSDVKADAQSGAPDVPADQGQRFELLVRGPDKEPVPRARVEIRTSPLPTAEQVREGKFLRVGNYGTFIQADANGRLILDLPQPPDRFNVSIQHPGFGPYWAGWTSEDHSEPVPSRFIADLDAGWSVGGVLVDDRGKPIEGARIRPSIKFKKRPGDAGELGVGTRITTDAEGRWRFDSVPDSKNEVHVEIDHPEFKPNRRSLTRGEFGLRPGEAPTARIEMQRGLTVTGRVTDEAGSPIAGATLRTEFLNDLREAKTDQDGRYRLSGCEPRMTRLVAFAPGRATDMREIRVSPEMEPVDFQMRPGGRLRVRVLDHEGRALARARIFFQRWRGRFEYFEFDHVSQYTNENGVWEWNEAPLDEFQADICPPGDEGMQLLKQPLVARDEEYVFRLPPPLVITGRVIDAETRRPVESFRVVPGIRSSESHMNWARGESYLAKDGQYRLRRGSGYLAHLVRIEAEGYRVAVSREIKSDEGQVRVDFALKKAEDVAATVLTPDGRPAAGARIALGIAGSQISVENGAIDDGSTYAARRDADDEGRFRFAAPEGPYQLVITHPSGFFHFKSHEKETLDRPDLPPLPVVLEKQLPERISLTAWARVEGVFRVGPRPVANAPITLNVDNVRSYGPDVPSIFTHHDVTTGPDGRFVFERAFPGEGRIGRRIVRLVGEGATEVASSQMLPVRLTAGETTRLDLGGVGRPVLGRLEPPAEHTEKVLWNFALVHLEADVPPLRQKRPDFTASVGPDGGFRIDDVPPGDYTLSVRFTEHSAGFLPARHLTIPKAEGEQAAEPVDLGVLTLQPVE